GHNGTCEDQRPDCILVGDSSHTAAVSRCQAKEKHNEFLARRVQATGFRNCSDWIVLTKSSPKRTSQHHTCVLSRPCRRAHAAAPLRLSGVPGGSSVVLVDALTPLVPLLRLDRQRRDRARLEPLERDRLAGLLAIAVGTVLETGERFVDLGDQLAL